MSELEEEILILGNENNKEMDENMERTNIHLIGYYYKKSIDWILRIDNKILSDKECNLNKISLEWKI